MSYGEKENSPEAKDTLAKQRVSNEESYLAANSNGRKFLYCSKGLDVISLLVKY